MKVKQFVFNHFQENCYVVWDEATKACAIVDPGAEAGYEDAQLAQFVEANGLAPKYVLLTHAHIDHIAGLREVCERYGLPVTMHKDCGKLLAQAEVYGSVMGFDARNMNDLKTNCIDEGDVLSLGAEEQGRIECRYVPGHCPGSLAYVLPEEKMVITGDALFRGSIGRTDLPGGDYQTLMESLRSRIMVLDDDYQVLPGHGDLSTIGEEHLYNGFLM